MFKSIVAAIEADKFRASIHMKLYDLYLSEAAALATCDVADATKEMKEEVTKRSINKHLTFLFLCVPPIIENSMPSSGNWLTSKFSGNIST